jgi:hypothetical protein
MSMRSALVAAVLLCAGGYLGNRLYQNTRTGPFDLWTLRAGMSFAALDDEEFQATKRRFVCRSLGEAGRFCQLHGRKMKGMLRLLVDDDDRAVVVQFWPAEDNPVAADEGRRLAAEWSRVRPPESARPDNGPAWATTSRWRTIDRKWSATIQYSCSPRMPTVIEVADDAALAAAIVSAPDAASVLADAHLIAPAEEAETSDAPRRAPGECGEPTFTRPSS